MRRQMPPMYEYRSGSIAGGMEAMRPLVENVMWSRSFVRVLAMPAPYQTSPVRGDRSDDDDDDDPFGVGLVRELRVPGVALRSTPGYGR